MGELTPKYLKEGERKDYDHIRSGPRLFPDPDARYFVSVALAALESLSECRGLVIECEWVSTNEPSNKYKMRCSKCRAIKPHHAPDCRIAAALKGVPHD